MPFKMVFTYSAFLQMLMNVPEEDIIVLKVKCVKIPMVDSNVICCHALLDMKETKLAHVLVNILLIIDVVIKDQF